MSKVLSDVECVYKSLKVQGNGEKEKYLPRFSDIFTDKKVTTPKCTFQTIFRLSEIMFAQLCLQYSDVEDIWKCWKCLYAELCIQYADNISVCWIIFENVKDYLLDSAFCNRALKMLKKLKCLKMFAELCLSMRMLKQAKAKAPPPQWHHFNLSTLVLPDLEQMFKNRTPSNYTNQLITIIKCSGTYWDIF